MTPLWFIQMVEVLGSISPRNGGGILQMNGSSLVIIAFFSEEGRGWIPETHVDGSSPTEEMGAQGGAAWVSRVRKCLRDKEVAGSH